MHNVNEVYALLVRPLSKKHSIESSMQEMTLHVTNSRKTNQTNEKQDKKENSFLKSKQYLSLISNMNKILNLSKAVNA